MYFPIALAVDGMGSLYVANTGDNTIEKFSRQGVGTKFNVSGDVNAPRGLAFDTMGNLYVSNYTSGIIEKFNRQGVGTRFNVSGDVNLPSAWLSTAQATCMSLMRAMIQSRSSTRMASGRGLTSAET